MLGTNNKQNRSENLQIAYFFLNLILISLLIPVTKHQLTRVTKAKKYIDGLQNIPQNIINLKNNNRNYYHKTQKLSILSTHQSLLFHQPKIKPQFILSLKNPFSISNIRISDISTKGKVQISLISICCNKIIMQIAKTTASLRKSKKSKQIRSKSSPYSLQIIPIVNQKKIPVHFRPYRCPSRSPTLSHDEKNRAEFWGCIVPPHIVALNSKKLQHVSKSLSRSKDKDRSWSSQKQKSEMLLTKYLSRKQKKLTNSPVASKCIDRTYENKAGSSKANLTSLLNQKSPELSIYSSPSKKWNYITNISTDQAEGEGNERSDYSDICAGKYGKQSQNSHSRANVIKELNSIIKWRAKLAANLQDELERIKNDKMWKY